MTNPKNDAMREAFEKWYLSTFPTKPKEGYKPERLTEKGCTDQYDSPFVNGAWDAWQAASKTITVQLTRNHDGLPMLILSNGQTILFKDIGGMADAVKAGEDDKRDAARYRLLRESAKTGEGNLFVDINDTQHATFQGLSDKQIDAAIDAQISAKGQS